MDENENQYPFDPERVDEEARLYKLALGLKFIPLPDPVQSQASQRVLDLGCASGAWVMDIAQQYPEWHITGFDISKSMIEYAKVRAQADGIQNVAFETRNVMQPLPFEDGTIDYIHIRMAQGFVRIKGWMHLFTECRRVLKPGGVIQTIESERPICNKKANTRYYSMLSQAAASNGVGNSPDGQLQGVCQELSGFLRDSGFTVEDETPYVVNYSARQPIHTIWCENILSAFHQFNEALVKTGQSAEELEALYQQAAQEMSEPDFRAIIFFLSVVGRKPTN